MGERLRGRAGQQARRRRLAAHPTCAECAKQGLVKATDQVDHIVPLFAGGEDVDSNVQGLCFLHHAIKTASESPSAEAVQNHPAWLKPALGDLTIVCGPPCAGKSTLVASEAAPSDVVIDLDAILAQLSPGYRPWHGGLEPGLLNRGIRVRNAMLGSLSARPARAWFIVGAPTHAERMWWHQQLGGHVRLLEPPLKVLEERAVKRGTPDALPGIRAWYAASRQRWAGPAKSKLPRQAFGPDGYPLEG